MCFVCTLFKLCTVLYYDIRWSSYLRGLMGVATCPFWVKWTIIVQKGVTRDSKVKWTIFVHFDQNEPLYTSLFRWSAEGRTIFGGLFEIFLKKLIFGVSFLRKFLLKWTIFVHFDQNGQFLSIWG